MLPLGGVVRTNWQMLHVLSLGIPPIFVSLTSEMTGAQARCERSERTHLGVRVD